jgi:8-oxo-dGTP pyrophosphatase MutT (NUDIX family)
VALLKQTLFLHQKKYAMVLFINDRPVHLIKNFSSKQKNYGTVILDFSKQNNIKEWRKKVLYPNATNENIVEFFKSIKTIKKFGFKSLTFVVEDIESAKQAIFDQYELLDAAGGVVLNENKHVLMIYRLGVWDLPKGKAENGETIQETAQREVEEECSIEVSLRKEFYISYHTYLHKNRRVLKRTYWYNMDLVSDANMAPQKEENIEKIKWMNRKQMHKAMLLTYSSIQNVLDHVLSQELNFSKG